ncbi:MAG: GGDEF domain-containing protein [Chloroflexi bacterium]|nr:GGDEF domain-containing protein [Chloroflexota bacterium]
MEEKSESEGTEASRKRPASPFPALEVTTIGLAGALVLVVGAALALSQVARVLMAVELVLSLGVVALVLALRERRRRELGEAQARAQQLEQRLRQTEEIALTDSLTGLWNSRHLHTQLPSEISRVKRRALALSLLLVDVDGLKVVNDRFGHATGDLLLKHVGAVLKEGLRPSDMVGRWGGDEYLALLPEAGKADALAVAKRLRSRLEQFQLKVDKDVLPITVSMGIATYPVDGEEAEDLFQKADAAMYLAKRRGSSHISVYAGPAGGQRKRVGEYLMELGVCTVEQMEEALQFCLESSKKGEDLAIGEALVRLGYASGGEVEQALALQARDRQRASP